MICKRWRQKYEVLETQFNSKELTETSEIFKKNGNNFILKFERFSLQKRLWRLHTFWEATDNKNDIQEK